MMKGTADNEKADIPKLAEFISVQSTDAHCRSTFAFVGRPNKILNADSDEMLVRVFSLNSVSPRITPASLRPRFLQLCHYFVLAGHSGKR